MTWFEQFTPIAEETPESVRPYLTVDGSRLCSRANGKSWEYGKLETLKFARLREKARNGERNLGSLSVRQVIANVQHLHAERENENVLFQVASQFNLFEMVSPAVTPESGVGIYEQDFTHGPTCAIAAGSDWTDFGSSDRLSVRHRGVARKFRRSPLDGGQWTGCT